MRLSETLFNLVHLYVVILFILTCSCHKSTILQVFSGCDHKAEIEVTFHEPLFQSANESRESANPIIKFIDGSRESANDFLESKNESRESVETGIVSHALPAEDNFPGEDETGSHVAQEQHKENSLHVVEVYGTGSNSCDRHLLFFLSLGHGFFTASFFRVVVFLHCVLLIGKGGQLVIRNSKKKNAGNKWDDGQKRVYTI